MVLSDEIGRIWQEVVVNYFKEKAYIFLNK
jgi:hypothetical protein